MGPFHFTKKVNGAISLFQKSEWAQSRFVEPEISTHALFWKVQKVNGAHADSKKVNGCREFPEMAPCRFQKVNGAHADSWPPESE